MNIKEYISSGLLEAYAMGALPEHERAEVAAAVAAHAELAAELEAIEAALIRHAASVAPALPADMADKIWAATQQQAPPATRTIPLPPPAMGGEPAKSNKWLYAAGLALLLASAAGNVWMYSQQQEQQLTNAQLAARVTDMEAKGKQLEGQLSKYAKATDLMADTAVKMVMMQTVQPSKPMTAAVYWNKRDGMAYVALPKMPPPPAGKQYQMWVIQGGKPVSMGVLPTAMEPADMYEIEAKLASIDAFAISLEPMGGNPQPTEVYVVGKI